MNRSFDVARFCAALWLVGFATAFAPAEAAQSPTLDRITQTKTIRIAYREDAPPFSYKSSVGEPAGYMIDLCKAVAEKLKDQLNLPSVSLEYVAVTLENRFTMMQQGKADILCEPTSATLARRQLVDFSIPTYVDGAGLMIRSDGPQSMAAMAGKKVGVLAGTTTETALHNFLKDANLNTEVILVRTYADGLAMLDSGQISAYFGDRSILESLIKQSKAPQQLMIATDYLTVEPYALGLPKGDEDFRLAVDTALSHIYRSGQIVGIYEHSFSGRARSVPIISTMYLISGLPDG